MCGCAEQDRWDIIINVMRLLAYGVSEQQDITHLATTPFHTCPDSSSNVGYSRMSSTPLAISCKESLGYLE